MAFPSDHHLADQIQAFSESISADKERWLYCLERSTMKYVCKDGRVLHPLVDSAMPASDRIIGCYRGTAKSRLVKIQNLGWDAAQEWVSGHKWLATRPYFYVGPMQAWNVGHVYFARVRSHPHVVKIGFSRRVRDRLDDIQSKNKISIDVAAVGLQVGTMLDEQRLHRDFAAMRISGEWFYDPDMSDRSLPAFLHVSPAEAA